MRTRTSLAAAVAALAAMTAAPAGAQDSCDAAGGSCSLNHYVSATVPTIAELTNQTPAILFPVTAADFDNSDGVNMGFLILEVSANVPWTLTVATATGFWAGPTGDTKPSQELRITPDGGSRLDLATTPQNLFSGTAGESLPLAEYNSLWSLLTDPPGNYEITVILTLSTP
ncbi:MAG: hypothetical protein ABR551_07355 [Gemmatimonadales bacterium]